MNNSNDLILKGFGFKIDERKIPILPSTVDIKIKSGEKFSFNTDTINKISKHISNELLTKTDITLPYTIDAKFMNFVVDYSALVEKQGSCPKFNVEVVQAATVLQQAVGTEIAQLFEKHFNYVNARADISVRNYLDIFGHFMHCSVIIMSESLIDLFAIAHKIILQHLPNADFDITQ